MKTLKYIFKKIADGFLYGIGIGTMVIIASYIFYMMLEKEMEGFEHYDEYVEFTPETKLIIEEENYKEIDEFSAEIIGIVINKTDLIWKNIQIEVELLDEESVLIDEFSEYISATLAPDQKENFKVNIAYCGDEKLPEFTNYTIRIVEAYHPTN